MNSQMQVQAEARSRYIAFLDECGDHSLKRIDPDFPLFLLALVVIERITYQDVILPTFNAFKLDYFNHEGINLHSREIRLSQGPFALLRNSDIRPRFLNELTNLMERVPFTLFVSAIRKQAHLERYGSNAHNPYELALEFTLERVAHFLEVQRENRLPIVAEARGRREDSALEQVFNRFLLAGTKYCPVERVQHCGLSLNFQPKHNNIIGIQMADLSAYPCARHILKPEKENRAFDIVRGKIYRRNGVEGWKIFP